MPTNAKLVATVDVLRGTPAQTVYRWEVDQWELLDRPAAEIAHEDARVAPIGLLVELEKQWAEMLQLEVGSGMKREGGNWIDVT